MELEFDFHLDPLCILNYCPACGGPNIEYTTCKGLGNEPGLHVNCEECGAIGYAAGRDEKAAADAWRDAKGI